MGLFAFNRARREAAKHAAPSKPVELDDMTNEQLAEYAGRMGVDISRVKSREAAIAKIKKAGKGAE